MVEHLPTAPATASASSADLPAASAPTHDPTHHPHQPEPGHAPMGAMLEPVLQQACDQRLSNISWFRTTWQRGGAATGYATFRDDAGIEQLVVVKMPVPPNELRWLEYLQPYPNVAPKLFAHGSTLGSYDLAWVVMERLPHGPMNSQWAGHEFDMLIEAAGRFYQATAAAAVGELPKEKDWKKILDMARRHIAEDHDVQHEQRWKNALKRSQKKLPAWLSIWNNRPRHHWIHGDLHLANALTRSPAPQGPAVLIDFAEAHPGHWVEDAVYFEHLYWARKQRLGGRKLVSQLAHERKKLGLHVDADWPTLAATKRALLAMSTPAMLQADGDRHHVEAALAVLEIEVGHG